MRNSGMAVEELTLDEVGAGSSIVVVKARSDVGVEAFRLRAQEILVCDSNFKPPDAPGKDLMTPI
ncbi:hypothetical protein L484_002241 [Morus notabilis]|uniref:Uncharacterized protein n=1 Tax=Morus notabilis TaxID=981085 RepID=W9SBV8_9ROSA|nr:hypothetical protein L484_002241 [Morus notabilis]